jgi:hypothetical protein
MAKIIENKKGRRLIQMSVDDVISVVREYQRLIKRPETSEGIRTLLGQESMFLPEEI